MRCAELLAAWEERRCGRGYYSDVSPFVLRVVAGLLVGAITGCGGPAVRNLESSGTTIVCLGDSITAGVGAGGGATYPQRLAELLGVPVVNAGVPGDTAAQGRARVAAVLAKDPWLVIIELGGNDLLQRVPVERTEADLAAIVAAVLDAGAVPLLVAVDNPMPILGRHLGEVYERVGDRYRVPVVDGVLRDILADRSLKSDEIHPNAAGYAKLAAAVAHEVRPLIAKRRRIGLGGTQP
jgi:acyl-CoA thioesterase I